MDEFISAILRHFGLKIDSVTLKLTDKVNVKIDINVDIKSHVEFNRVDDHTVNMTVHTTSAKDIPLLGEAIASKVESDKPVLDTKMATDVSLARTGLKLSKEDQELLEYYKPKLTPRLYEIFELALVLRNMRRKHLDVRSFKLRIMRDYPQYGGNMCNLVNEKYFDYKFKELYAQMSQEKDFRIEKYQEEIRYQVERLPSVVFIDARRNQEELKAEIRWRLLQMNEYGLEEVSVHAISWQNVELAEKLLSELSQENENFNKHISKPYHVTKQSTYFKAVFRKKQ